MWKPRVWGIAALLTGLWTHAAGAGLIVFSNYGPDWSHHDGYGWTVSGWDNRGRGS